LRLLDRGRIVGVMSDEEAAPDSAAGDPVEHDPEQQSAGSIGRQIAAYGTLALAVVGAMVFGLLSLGAAIAYSPLGVRPSEIGLGSAALLTQSAIAVVFAAAVFGLADLVLMYQTERSFSLTTPRLQRLVPKLILYVLIIVAGVLLIPAFTARSALENGSKPNTLILTLNPWSAEVAHVAWAHEEPPEAEGLPTCVLYLGQADGTSVLYDGKTQQTWRIPSSELIVRAMPSLTECP
jgi:hypothetical protein